MHPIDEYADDSINNYDRNSAGPNEEPRSSTPASRGQRQTPRGQAETPVSKGDSKKEQEMKEDEVD